jgi:hypothetical protein
MFGTLKKIHPFSGVYSAENQDRTGDPTIFSRVLYQLSYLGGGCILPVESCTVKKMVKMEFFGGI